MIEEGKRASSAPCSEEPSIWDVHLHLRNAQTEASDACFECNNTRHEAALLHEDVSEWERPSHNRRLISFD
jgi:hypothetical protein